MAGKPRYLCAYAFASGHIFFGNTVPPHAIEVARGPQKTLRDFITSQCIVGFGDDAPLLAPGVAEAETYGGKIAALQVWTAKIVKKAPDGVIVDTTFSAHRRGPGDDAPTAPQKQPGDGD